MPNFRYMTEIEQGWTTEIRPKDKLLSVDFKEIWQYRDLMMLFVKRNIITQYKQTILGPLWFVIQPLMTTVMYMVVFGGNVNGVGMASQYYFSKDAKELTLEESAFLAGITHSPNNYNPFGETDRTERIKTRTKTVLYQMKDQGKISEEEYNKAVETVEKGLKFNKCQSN